MAARVPSRLACPAAGHGIPDFLRRLPARLGLQWTWGARRPLPVVTVDTDPEREVFPSVKLSRLAEIAQRYGDEVRLESGDTLFEARDEADALYIVVSGILRVHLPDQVVQLGRGNVCGEIGVINEGLRSATVTAGADTVLRRLSNDAVRRHISAGTREALGRLTTERLAVWRSVKVGEDNVRLIGVHDLYRPAVEWILRDEGLRAEVLRLAGINPRAQKVRWVAAQYGGEGTIKYVVWLGVRVDGRICPIGLRFYTDKSRCFRNAAEADRSAIDEIQESRAFYAARRAGINIYGYVAAEEWFGGRLPQPFLDASIFGMSVGEYIVFSHSRAGFTGVGTGELGRVFYTVTQAWLLRRGQNQKFPDRGPTIGDVKPEQWVIDRKRERGNRRARYVDFGHVTWVDFCTMLAQHLELAGHQDIMATEADILRALPGFSTAVYHYAQEELAHCRTAFGRRRRFREIQEIVAMPPDFRPEHDKYIAEVYRSIEASLRALGMTRP